MLEVAVFDVPVLADEHESVRLEELAQVAFGEEPRVRVVPGALECIERKGFERVCGGKLIDDEEAPSEARDARELRDDELGAGHVMQRPKRPAEIEGVVLEVEAGGIALDEVDVRRCTFAGECEELRHAVDADDVLHVRRKRESESTGAAADIDCTLVPARQNERLHARCEIGRARILLRCDQWSCTGEAVLSHRRPPDGRVWGRSRFRKRAHR